MSRRCLYRLDCVAFAYVIRRVERNGSALVDARQNLYRSTVVTSDGNLVIVRDIMIVNYDYLRAAGVEQERIRRYDYRCDHCCRCKIHLHKASGKERVVRVGDINFYQQRTGARIERVSGARYSSGEYAATLFGERHVGTLSNVNRRDQRLWYVDVHAHRIGLRNAKQAEPAGAGATGAGTH